MATYLLPAQESGDEGQLLDGIGVLGPIQEVDVPLAGRLVLLRLPVPPAVAERRHVRQPARPEVVQARRRHRHARARQLPPLGRRHRQRVHQRVVDAVPPAADERPRRLVLAPPGRVRRLPGHRLLPPEVGVQEQEARDGRAAVQPAPRARAHGHVVRDVGAGAVPGDEQPGQVAPVPQPRLRPGPGVPGHPVERLPRVVVRRRQPVLRRQAVLHGHRHHARLRRHAVQVGVVQRRERRLDDERAAVVEHQHRVPLAEALALRPAGRRGQVHPCREPGPAVDHDVLGGHPCGLIHAGRAPGGAVQPVHAAALVHDEVR
uniref:Uncharacterized protein n=1 Tax=Zea mays TaxID=4577 RepID=A0A804UDR1_MAIZE